VDEPVNGLDSGHAGAYEDRGNDRQPGASLRYRGAQSESDPKRDGGQGIAEVVDQVGKQGNAAAGDEHDGLSDCRQAENG
jgi:hypothetical protein